jgi:large subunit ribosomal protein L15
MLGKTHKRRKSSRHHGMNMGTGGTGARKNKRHKGMKGGKGLSGTGKRADHKKTLVLNLYGNKYFGKKGITSRGTKRDKRERINVSQIEENMSTFEKKGLIKEGILDLSKYNILGKGEIAISVKVKALRASKSAIEKIKKAGGEIILPKKKEVVKKDSLKKEKPTEEKKE